MTCDRRIDLIGTVIVDEQLWVTRCVNGLLSQKKEVCKAIIFKMSVR